MKPEIAKVAPAINKWINFTVVSKITNPFPHRNTSKDCKGSLEIEILGHAFHNIVTNRVDPIKQSIKPSA